MTLQEEVNDFIIKAQHKIADLTTVIIETGGTEADMELLLELSNFLRTLFLPYNETSQKDIVSQIDTLSQRANLVSYPLLPIVGFGTEINLPISVAEVSGAPLVHKHEIEDINGLLEALEEGGSGGTIGEDVPVIGVTVGGVTDGDVILGTATIGEALAQILQKELPPVYVLPTGSLNGFGGNFEVGTTITPNLTPLFNVGDSGGLSTYSVTENGATVASGTNTGLYSASKTIGEETLNYRAVFNYSEGVTKNTNKGNPYPTGKVVAGSVLSNIVSFVGKRRLFYGTSEAFGDSAGVRAAYADILGPTDNMTFTINIPVGAVSVDIAYPKTLRPLTKVSYVEGLNADVKGAFVETEVSVEGVDGFNAIPYRVYKYTPAQAFGQAATYIVTI